MKLFLAIFSCIFLTSCGYRFDGREKIAVSVPYVVGDDNTPLFVEYELHFARFQADDEPLVAIHVVQKNLRTLSRLYDLVIVL